MIQQRKVISYFWNAEKCGKVETVTVMPTRISLLLCLNVKRELTVNTGNLWSDITDHLPNCIIISPNEEINIYWTIA